MRFDNDDEALSSSDDDAAAATAVVAAAAADDDDDIEAEADNGAPEPCARVLATMCITMGCTDLLKSFPLAPLSPSISRPHAPTASMARERARAEQRQEISWGLFVLLVLLLALQILLLLVLLLFSDRCHNHPHHTHHYHHYHHHHTHPTQSPAKNAPHHWQQPEAAAAQRI